MKSLTQLTVCLFATFGALNLIAGPEPIASNDKDMKQVVAPAPSPACQNWAGFYVGGFGGYKFSVVDLNTDLGSTWNQIPQDRDFVEDRSSKNLNHSGGEAGGLFGYNWQFGCWVVGVEADGGYLWSRDSYDTGYGSVGNFFPIKTNSSFETHYLATFAPRIGYSLGRLLPYVTGGLALGDLDYTQSIQTPQSIDVYRQRGSVHDTNAGWMVGGGLQYALTNHWSIRGQYEYIDLGSADFHTSDIDSSSDLYTGTHEATLHEHNVSAALIFGF